MEEDIKILERVCQCRRFSGVYTDVECIFKAIENLIARNKELEEQIQRKEGIIKHLQNSNEKYYEDNVRLLRKNGHIDILSDNLHYKYWDDIKNYIPKSKVKEKIEEYKQEDLEIYDTDSEDVRIAKYEQRAILEVLQELMEGE